MPATEVGFPLAVVGFVLWVTALTLLLPRALAYGVAFASNRALARKAHLSIGALYLYPLAGRFVAHRLVYADADAAVSVGEVIVVWRWWRRGRLTAFDDAASAASSVADESTCASWLFCWRPAVAVLREFLSSASPLRDENPAALLSFTCSGLRVRVISMKANYDLLERLRAYAAGDIDDDDYPLPPTPLDDSQPRKTMVDHLLEYSSLKVNSGALYVCDPGNSPLARVLFNTAKIRYRHGRPRSRLDLFRFTLSVRITELRISVAEKGMLRDLGIDDPPDADLPAPHDCDPEERTCWSVFSDCATAIACMGPADSSHNRSRNRSHRRTRNNCSCFSRRFYRFSRAKPFLQCAEIVHASEAYIEYVCDEPGPDVPDPHMSNEDSGDLPLPPELRTTVELQGASITYEAKAISCLQDVQERLFPRLFDLTRVAEEFQGRMRRRVPHSFVLDIVAIAKIDAENSDRGGDGSGSKIPLVSAPYMPRENTWRLLQMMSVNRGKSDDSREDSKLPESNVSIYSEKVSVHTEIPYKLGDPLNVRADLPDVQLVLEGVVEAPICTADAINVVYQIKFPKVWNHVHRSRCDCTVYSGEFTYMPDLIRCIDDLAATIDEQSRKPEDVRYFVPNSFSVSINAVEGYSVRLAASRGNTWADIFKGLSDDFGMAVLKGENATLSLDLNAGLEYQPSVIPVQWGLHLPMPSLFLALPCPQPSDDPFGEVDYGDDGDEQSVLNTDAYENLTFAQRVRLLIDGTNGANGDAGAQKPGNGVRSRVKKPRPLVNGREDEQVLIRIIEVGGLCTLQGRVTTHDSLYADGINQNRVMIRISGIAFDLNPHHLQHLLNIIANCSSLTNHTLTADEKHRIDTKRRALAHDIVADGRIPTFEECILLGTEGGISLATSAYHAGGKAPPATAMDDAATIDLEIDGGCLMLHNLPNALCSFSAHSSQVCSIDVGHASFALNGNHKEVVARFAPVSEDSPFKLYPGQPRELKANIFRRAQNRPLKEHSLAKYPQVALSEFLLTRQGLFNKQLGAYYSDLDISVGKVEGCIQETTLNAIIGFVKSVSVRPAYDEAPVVEALVGVQSIQVRVGRTDVLILCGSQTASGEQTAGGRKSSAGLKPSLSGRGSTRKRQRSSTRSVPVSVFGIAQFRLRDGLRVCMSNFATSEYLSRTGVTIPDLSVQLFTPWGGSSTPWIDEPTLRAQVSHSSAIKAWRQVGVQQGRAVMHRAGVFENFVLRLIWESHPSLWSDTVHILQRSRLEVADRYARRIAHLWEAQETPRNNGVSEDPPTVLESYNSKWWQFLDCAARRESRSITHQSSPATNSLRRDVVSVFILADMTLLIGPEALELANYIATNIRSAKEERRRSTREDAGDLVEIWRDLNAQSALSEDHDRLRGEHRTPRVHGTTVNCNLFVAGASVYLICPVIAEDVMDRAGVQPVIVRDERVCASFPQGLQLSYRWRSQRGATGVPSPVEDLTAGPTSPSYSLSLRQSAFVKVPLIVVESSLQQMATVSHVQGRLADSVTYRRKRRIGGDLEEETHRGSHRTFDVSVASCSLGKPGSDLAAYSELGRVLSIYGLMFRALSLDVNATFQWQQERRDASCEAVFAVPFYVLAKLSPAQIQVVCFGRQVRFLKSNRYIPQGASDDVQNSFLASEELESNLVSIARLSKETASRPYTGKDNIAACSVSVRAGINEFAVALCDREAFAIRRFVGEAQFEMVEDPSVALQEPPLARISVGSVTISLRDDVADSGLRAVSAVASYIRFAASYIPMLSYEVEVRTPEEIENGSMPPRNRAHSRERGHVSTPGVSNTVADDPEDVPKRSRYSVRHSTRFKLRRSAASQDSPQDILRNVRASPSWTPRGRRKSIEEASIGQGRSTVGSADQRDLDESRDDTSRRQSAASKRRSGRPSFYSSSGTRRADKRDQDSSQNAVEQRSRSGELRASRDLQSLYEESIDNAGGLKNVFQIYQAPRVQEASASGRFRGTKRTENDQQVDPELLQQSPTSLHLNHASEAAKLNVDNQKTSSRPVRNRESRSRRNAARKSREDKADVQSLLKKESSYRSKLQMSNAHAATIVCSVNDLEISYFRSESRHLYGTGSDQRGLSADLAIAVKKMRASGVVTPFARCQSFIVTVDDISLRSGNSTSCVLESSVKSVVAMMSISSGVLPSHPKRIVSSSKISDFRVSLRAQDVRSVIAFSEKFKKDIKSLASSAVSTRTSLAAMARATKLETLTRTSAPRVSFATVAVDISFEKVCASLLGFHPADKEMKISYEVDSIFGSLVETQDSSIALSLGGLVYGHGLVLSSPSWSTRERFDFPALDARGVQWMHTTGLPTQVKVTAGHLVSTTSFQGLRHVLFAVSGLLAFQNRSSFYGEQAEVSMDFSATVARNDEGRSVQRVIESSPTPEQNSATLSRSWLAWERTKAVRMEYAVRPMSIGLVSGGVMAGFDTERISGVIEWNKLVSSGNQLQAVLQLPQFSITYSKVDGADSKRASDEARAENSSLLVAIQDVRLDLLKSQVGLTHNFIFRVNVVSVNGQLRPWRLMSDAAVWANEQDVVKEFQAVNSDAALRGRNFPSVHSDLDATTEEQNEHRIIVLGVDVNSVRVAVPLLDSEHLQTHRLGVTATEVRYQMRLGDEIALPSQSNLAQLRSAFVGVVWEDSAFLSAHRAEVMFAAQAPTEGKKAHFGAIRGSCATETWIVCPRKDVVLAFIEAKGAPENVASSTVTSPMPRSTSSRERLEAANLVIPADNRRQLFQSVEFMVLPSQGYIRGLDPMDVFSGQSARPFDADDISQASRGIGELSIPTFSVAWLRRPAFDFDLVDVDFSMKRDEFPEGILRKTGNIFSELFGAIATSSEDTSAGDVEEFTRVPPAPRQITRDWSALIRFGESRYVAREYLTDKLNARLEFYAGKHAGFLASVSASPHPADEGTENATVVTGVAPLLSLEIKPALLNAETQCLQLGFVRILQGYAPSVTPHTFAHLTEVNAEMDVMTALLVREWLKREQRFKVTRPEDIASPETVQDVVKTGAPRNSKTVIVLGRPARSARDSWKKLSPPRRAEPAVRIILRLSQPDGRVGLLIQRIHVGVAMEKVRSSTSGYLTDVHIGLHQIEARADWESLYCSFKLKRLLFRFEGERAMCEENICGFAGIVNNCEFDFKRADIDALSLQIEGVAGACRVPDCDLAVQTTEIDASISSLTGKMIERLLHLAARLAREARRQVESLALSEASAHDAQMGFTIDAGGSGPGFDALRPRIKGAAGRRGGVAAVRGSQFGRGKSVGSASRPRAESRRRQGFLNATAFLSGARLSVTMHGYQFEETNGAAKLKFIQYELDYKQQAGFLHSSRDGSGSIGSSRSVTSVRQLKVMFEFLDLCYSHDPQSTPYSMLRVPEAILDLSVHEKGSTATVDFETKFEKEIEIGTAISHFDRLRGLLKLYAESRSQVAKELDKTGDLRMLPMRRMEEEQKGPFGGRIPDFRNLKLKPQLKILGELTPDLTILERFGLGKKEVIEQAIPAGLYDYVMVPVGSVVEGLTRPLL